MDVAEESVLLIVLSCSFRLGESKISAKITTLRAEILSFILILLFLCGKLCDFSTGLEVW